MHTFKDSDFKSIFAAVLASPSSLRDLQLKGVIEDDDRLQQLGTLLATNTPLKVLNLSSTSSLSSAVWCSFFTSIPALKEIDLSGDIESNAVMTALTNYLSSNHSL